MALKEGEMALTYADVTGMPVNPMHERLRGIATEEEIGRLDELRDNYNQKEFLFDKGQLGNDGDSLLGDAFKQYDDTLVALGSKYEQAQPVRSRDQIDITPRGGLGSVPFIQANMRFNGLRVMRAVSRRGGTGTSMQLNNMEKLEAQMRRYKEGMEGAHPVYEECAYLSPDMSVEDYLNYIQQYPEAMAVIVNCTRNEFNFRAPVLGIMTPELALEKRLDNPHIGELDYPRIEDTPTVEYQGDYSEAGKIKQIARAALQTLVEHNQDCLPVMEGDVVMGVASRYAMGSSLRFQPHLDQREGHGGLGYLTSLSPISTPLDKIEYFIKERLLGRGISFDLHQIDHGTDIYAYLRKVRALIDKHDPSLMLSAGNIANADGALRLANAGVKMVKVGVGPAESCTTRVHTGFGIPQFDLIQEVRESLDKHGFQDVLVIADGGLDVPGYVSKALARADFVMAGSRLGRTHESRQPIKGFDIRNFYGTIHPGETVLIGGSASDAAQEKRKLDIDKMSDEQIYRAVTGPRREGHASPQPMHKDYRTVSGYMRTQITDGLTGGMYMSCSDNMKEHRERFVFVQQTASGIAEGGHRHG